MLSLRCLLLLLLLVSVSYVMTLQTCNLSYWVNPNNTSCSGTPNGTYPVLNYTGQCTPVPNDPSQAFYQLLIDPESRTVHSFAVFQTAKCQATDLLFNTTIMPIGLSTCQPLNLMNGDDSFITVGNILFGCRD